MKKQEHILVVSQYFYPEQFRINDICTEWVKRGYKVTVVTGIPNYPKGKYFDGYGLFKKRSEQWNGMDIIRIPLVPRGNNSIQLAFNYASFVVSGFFWKIFTRLKPDKVFIYEVSPMTQALVGVWLAKRRKIPCYLYVTDLWPENFEYITGIHSKAVISPIVKMVKYIYKACDTIFTSSRSFMSSVVDKGVCTDKVVYWPQYAEDFYFSKSIDEIDDDSVRIRQENKFHILFAGNIGEAQGLDVLVKAADELKKTGFVNVLFCIVGEGRYKDTLMEKVQKQGVNDMFAFYPRIPATQVPDVFAQTDASLICLSKSDVFAITLPAKTQSCLACGKPIVVCADGEIQTVIEEAKCGVIADAGDSHSLTQAIIHLIGKNKNELNEMAENAVEYYNKNFDKKMLLDVMDKYLAEKCEDFTDKNMKIQQATV